MTNRFNYLLFACVWANVLLAQPNRDYYWKGGSGDFNQASNWWLDSYGSGITASQSPVSSNNVYFTAAAFPSAGAIIRVAADANCKDMIWDNSITTNPKFKSVTSANLSIYGSLNLAPTMQLDTLGNLHFKAPSGLVTLTSNGKIFKLYNMNIALGATAELRLADDLTVENPGANNNQLAQGWISFLSGHFNTNAKKVSFDFFTSTNSDNSRRLTIANSALYATGVAYQQYSWRINFSGSNYAGFSAAGSHLHLENSIGSATAQYFGGGSVAYDSISIDHTVTRFFINSQNVTSNYFAIRSAASSIILNGSTITSNQFYIGANAAIVGQNTNRISTDVLITPSGCDMATIQNERGTFTLQKKTAGNLTFSNLALAGITGDVSSGRSYTANDAIDANANTNITFNAPTGCPTALWFRGATTDWHTLSNWRDAPTGGNIPTSLPTLTTDVYFDAQSFTTVTQVSLTQAGYTNHMRWDNTVAGARIALSASGLIFCNGTLQMPANAGGVTGGTTSQELGRSFVFYGNGDSIITNGINITGSLFMARGSDYTIIDSLTASMLYQYQSSTIRVKNAGLRLSNQYIMARRIFDNGRITFSNSGWNTLSDLDNSLVQYTNNSIFYFNGSGIQMANGTTPNVVVNNSGFYLNSALNVQGDITFNTSCQTSMQSYGSAIPNSQLSVTGNMSVVAGKEIVFRDYAPTNSITINGNLNVIGACNQITTIRTYNGTAIPFTVGGTANVQYAYLQGLNSTNPIIANNSVDGGNNSNITFTTGTGTTYYWRADRTNSTDFIGNWTNPDHWTTNSANTVGDGACIPTLADNVVFDALSFSGSSNGCVIDANAFCNNFTCTAGIRIQSPSTGVGSLFINGNYTLHSAVTWSHTGYINMVGSGSINTAGKTLNIREFVFKNPTGTWTLQSDLTVLHTSLNSELYGIMRLISGTFNTNNYNVTVGNRFESSGTGVRSLVLGNSIWTMNMTGLYQFLSSTDYFAWNTPITTNMTLSGGTIRFLDGNVSSGGKRLQMGNLTYNRLEITDTNEEIQLYGNASYSYARLAAATYVDNSNSFDSLYLEGGYTYRFKANTTQTLNAPHGKIISGGSSNNFVFIESASPSVLATFYKPYGNAFCVDFIKTKDLNGTKMVLASVPAAYQAIHPFLEFQTGVNSDNINNSTVGIWAFNLPLLVTPVSSSASPLNLCSHTSPATFPVSITGTSPYLIQYSWNDGSTSGTGSVTVSDDDSDPSTAFVYALSMASAAATTTYTFNITTYRCGEQTVPSPRTIVVNKPSAKPLVSVNRSATCILYNEPVWHTLIDNVDAKPVAALLDQVNAGDVSALGSTTADVYFDGTQQYYNILGANYPYLKRHWKIIPTNNGAARVRLFFTQAELNALAPYTFHGQYGGTLNPATNIQVLKFASGTIGVGGHTVVSHTVVPVTGSVATPFSATSGIIAIEFDVTSFSHFIIVPNQSALLPLHLLSFDAKSVDNKAVRVDWTTAEDEDVRMYYVERSLNAIESEIVGNVAPLNVRQETDYQLIDNNPYQGVSYYRVKAVKTDGSSTVSDWKAITIEKGNDVAVYPNPANDAINLEIRADIQVANVRIIDVLGRVVYSAQWAAANGAIFSIPTQQLESGSYLIQVTDDANFSKQKRITIQH